MAVVPLTVIVSLCLVVTFLVFFLGQHARSRLSSAERDSLLPFEEEQPRFADAASARTAEGEGGPRAGRSGLSPAGPGCLKGDDRHS